MDNLEQYLQSLNLTHIMAIYQKEAQECMQTGVSYEMFLQRLLEQEVLARMNKKIQAAIKKAHFPSLKTVEGFDFAKVPSLDQKRFVTLLSGEYADKAENVLALGNSGTGKTHLAIALGMAVCQQGHGVLFKTAAQLVHGLIEAHDARKLIKLQKKLEGYKVLIIDELGYVPFSKTGAELLFEVFSQRYENSSVIVTSNLPFEEWPQVFGCSRLTGALLDRLTHHVHIMETNKMRRIIQKSCISRKKLM